MLTSADSGSTWSNVFNVAGNGNTNIAGNLAVTGTITLGLNGSTFTGMKRYTGNLDADGTKTIALGTGKGAKTVVIGAKVSSTSQNYYSLGRFLSTVITGDSLMIIPDNNGAPITFNKTCTYQVWCIETS